MHFPFLKTSMTPSDCSLLLLFVEISNYIHLETKIVEAYEVEQNCPMVTLMSLRFMS